MTPKLKPGAEELITIQADRLPELDSESMFRFAITWTLANLPKLLEATDISTPNSGDWDKMCETKTGKIHFCHNFKPVAIVEVE